MLLSGWMLMLIWMFSDPGVFWKAQGGAVSCEEASIRGQKQAAISFPILQGLRGEAVAHEWDS